MNPRKTTALAEWMATGNGVDSCHASTDPSRATLAKSTVDLVAPVGSMPPMAYR
jgi:hypothetical protein